MTPMSPALNLLLRTLLLAISYFVVGGMSLSLAIPPGFAVPVWPAAGIALAAILIGGYQLLPGVFLGAFAANLLIGGSDIREIFEISRVGLFSALGIGAGATLQAALAAVALRRLVEFPTNLSKPADIAALLVVGGAFGCLTNALIGPLSLYAFGILSLQSLPISIYTWWAGDAIGVMLFTPLLLLLWSPNESKARKVAVAVPIILLATFTTVAFLATSDNQKEQARQKFESAMREVVGELDKRLAAHIGVLKSVESYVRVHPNASQQEFSGFIAEFHRRHPATYVLSWNPRVTRTQRLGFEARKRHAGEKDFRILERAPSGDIVVAGDRSEYFPCALISPLELSRSSIGKDILNPDAQLEQRMQVLSAARDSGRALIDERVKLQRYPNEYGFVLYNPVYSEVSPQTTDARRASLSGYVLGVFRVSQFLDTVAKFAQTRNADFVVHDISAPDGQRFLFDTRNPGSLSQQQPIPQPDEALLANLTIEFGGHDWRLTFIEKSIDDAIQRGWYSWYILLGGLLLSGLAGAFLLIASATFASPTQTLDVSRHFRSPRLHGRDGSSASTLIAVVAGAVAPVIGVVVILGWYLKSAALIQILPSLVPMQFNTALGFVFCGLAFFSLMRGYTGQVFLWSVPVIVLAALTLLEYAAGIDLGIDQMFMQHYITLGTSHPGRMAPNTALCFLVFAGGIFFAARNRGRDTGQRVLRASAWIVLILSAMALVGYALKIESAYGWMSLTNMALHTAVGFLLLAIAVFFYAGRGARDLEDSMQALVISALSVSVMLLLAIGLWQELAQQQARLLRSEFFIEHSNRPELEVLKTSSLPELVLAAGILMALLLGMAVYYATTASQRNRLLYRQGAALQQSRGRLAAIIDTAPDGILSVDGSGRIMEVNDAVTSIFGYDQGQLLGMMIHELLPIANRAAHVSDVARYVGSAAGQRDMAAGREVTGLRSDGSSVAVEVRLGKSPQPDGSVQVVATVRDVTERIAAEKERELFIEQLSDSNEELQRFAYVCSHDLQEPLRTVRSFSDRLSDHLQATLAEDERAATYLQFIETGAERAQQLITDILDYSRVQQDTLKYQAVDLNDTLAKIETAVTADLESRGGRIEYADLPVVQGNEVQLYQLFQNLVNNGLKYQPADSIPHITIACVEFPAHWQFEVRDNGIGIAPQHLDKIFNIFQRLHTKSEYPGTGVGLAISRKVAERHGGSMWAESTPGQGTSIFFTLAKNQSKA